MNCLRRFSFVSVTSITGHGSTTQTQQSTPSTSAPGGKLEYKFDKVVGTGSNDDGKTGFWSISLPSRIKTAQSFH